MESKKYKIIKKKKKKKKDRDVLTSSKVDFQLTHIAMAWNGFFFFFFLHDFEYYEKFSTE